MKGMNPKIETNPTIIKARAEIAHIRNEYYQAVICHRFRRASDLNGSIKSKEKKLRATIKQMEKALC